MRASPGIAQRPSQCNIKTLNSDPRVEDEMVGWHDQLDGHEFEQTPEDGEGQGSLECCSPWGCKELETTEQLNNYSLDRMKSQYLLVHCLSSAPAMPNIL